MGISVMGTGHILTAELHYHPMHLISSVLICILEKSETKKIQKIINNIIIKVDDTIKKKKDITGIKCTYIL